MIYDKRKLKRYDIFLIVEFKPLRSPGGFSIGITRDLSPDGFSLETQTIECQRGDIMEFRLKHPDAEWTVDISGEVIWRNHSWYKYIIGIKFLEVNEEQNTKILKLMSAVRDAENKPDLISKDSESIQGTEKEKTPEAMLGAGAMDNPLPDTRIINTNHITLKDAEHCELTGSERTFIARDVSGTSSDNGKKDINPPEDADESEKRFKETLSRDIDAIENNRKKKLWLYVPLAMVVIIILVIALPVIIEKFNHASIDFMPVSTESTDNNDIEKDKDISVSYKEQMNSTDLNAPSVPPPVRKAEANDAFPSEQDRAVNLRQASAREDSTGILPPISIDKTVGKGKKTEEAAMHAGMGKIINNTSEMNNANILKPELSAGTKADPGNVEKGKKIDLIAKIDQTFKDLRAIQNEKPRETEVVIKTEKTPEDKPLVKTEEQPVTLQVVKLEETPAAVAVTESERIPVFKQEVKAGEEKKGDIKNAEQSVKRPGMPNVALLVKRDNSRISLNNSPAAPVITTADLLKKWKHIGSTKSGVPLFIAPDNISYPYEHVVNLLVKASVNKKDFIDLLAINCSQIKLRILEERNGNNPVFSSYSNEWKDILPDSMILYNSACPENK